MKKLIRILSLAMIVCTLVGVMILPAHAATSGTTGTRTIYAETKANWWYPGAESITLKQSKIKATYTGFFNSSKTTTREFYGVYNITVCNNSTGARKTYKLTGASLKIKLDRNASYTITVQYDSNATFLKTPYPTGWIYKSQTNPSWWVSGSCKCTYW